MGTNYYWNPELIREAFGIDDIDRDDPKVHIGKLSAAGRYCKPCGITQHGHSVYVHDHLRNDVGEQCIIDITRLDEHKCPNCNQPWSQANSFTFTMLGHLQTLGNFYNLDTYGRQQKGHLYEPKLIVVDEMERLYTSIAFMDEILRSCPLQYQHYGRWS